MKKGSFDKPHKQSPGPGILLTGIFLLTALVCLLAFHFLYTPFVTTPPKFTDFIIEATAESGYNKAGELLLFRLLALLGMLLIAAGIFWGRSRLLAFSDGGAKNLTLVSYTPLLFLFPAAAYLLLSGIVSGPLFFMAGYSALICLLSRRRDPGKAAADALSAADKSLLPLILIPVFSYYALLGILTFLTLLSPAFATTTSVLYIGAILLTLLSLCIIHFKPGLRQITIFLLQLPIFLLLTVYLRDTYLYRGETVRIPFAPAYYGIVAALFFYSLLSLFRTVQRGRKRGLYDTLVAKAVPMVIFLYRSYQCCPMFAQPDQHHHGEQMIPWQQIFMLHRQPYEEYTPVSGLFPLVNGLIQNVFFHHTVSDYAPALSLTTALLAFLTMYLLCLHIGADKAVIFAMLFSLPAYNRQYLVLPALLLLYLPSLLQKRSRWLRIWLFTCFVCGLYYPLFGAAVLAGTLPLLVSQLRLYLKSGEWQKELKTFSFYGAWLLTLVPIILCLPLLIRMAVHTLTFSSQTILADGISLAGQQPPDSFLPYLASASLRQTLYLPYRFFLPVLPLWLVFMLFLTLLLPQLKKQLRSSCPDYLLHSLFTVFTTLAVSYSYTLVRADTDVRLARTAPILLAVAGLFLASRLIQTALPSRTAVLLSALCCCLPFFCYAHTGDLKTPALWTYPDGNDKLVADDASKLFTYYEVPESFGRLSDYELLSDASMLGDGFMVMDQFPYLTQYDKVLTRLKNAGLGDTSYMGYDGQGFYYYLGTRACATGYLPVARSSQAQKRLVERANKDRPVIFPLEPQKSYYLFDWLVSEEADYVYDTEDQCFYPHEIYDRLIDQSSQSSDVSDRGLTGYLKDKCEPLWDMNRIGESFGNSADILLSQRTDRFLSIGELTPEALICGSEYNLLNLPLADSFLEELCQKNGIAPSQLRLQVLFDSSASAQAGISCLTGSGNLLIPLGMNPHWSASLTPHKLPVLLFTDDAGNILCRISLSDIAPCLNADKKEDAGLYHITSVFR